MKTQNEFAGENLGNESPCTEAMNDESITAKVRQAIEEWNEQEKTCDLNRFKNPDATTSTVRLMESSDQ